MGKYYAVRKGHQTGIFNDWPTCQKAVKGYSGAEFKSFKTKKEAEDFLNGGSNAPENIPLSSLIAYVDGSYDRRSEKAGFGAVLIVDDKVIHTKAQRAEVNPKANLWNVGAEIAGILYAVDWAIKNGYPEIYVHYDYLGLEKWYTKEWQAKNEVTQQYVRTMHAYKEKIKIHFYKVKAHTGVKYNELADELAKQAVNK